MVIGLIKRYRVESIIFFNSILFTFFKRESFKFHDTKTLNSETSESLIVSLSLSKNLLVKYIIKIINNKTENIINVGANSSITQDTISQNSDHNHIARLFFANIEVYCVGFALLRI
jgi:hypothetical protein